MLKFSDSNSKNWQYLPVMGMGLDDVNVFEQFEDDDVTLSEPETPL